MTTSDK